MLQTACVIAVGIQDDPSTSDRPDAGLFSQRAQAMFGISHRSSVIHSIGNSTLFRERRGYSAVNSTSAIRTLRII